MSEVRHLLHAILISNFLIVQENTAKRRKEDEEVGGGKAADISTSRQRGEMMGDGMDGWSGAESGTTCLTALSTLLLDQLIK